jgi:enamine deaminase RidA (YjgF/YER057c/UK114 family)
VEAWAIGGPGVVIKRHTPHSVSVSYDGIRWVHCAGVGSRLHTTGAYRQTREVLDGLGAELQAADGRWEDVVRTWLYLGGITAPETGGQRYCEMNRARSDAFANLHFGRTLMRGRNGHPVYPASTGIGMLGQQLTAGCLALQTARPEVRLLPLENPGQTPAYRYGREYSPESPKFSRAMAVLLGDYATTWISGTASIVNSETVFPDDIERQTHQTLDNIERLIAPENFALHGASRSGATLEDLAKVRVYVKRKADYGRCRAVCERRLGNLPTLYAIADVCRPELLVEIEGVAFSPLGSTPGKDMEVLS